MKAKFYPGHLTVQATETISVSYDKQFNLVEIAEEGKVIRSEVAPARYTIGFFMETVDRVKTYYNQN